MAMSEMDYMSGGGDTVSIDGDLTIPANGKITLGFKPKRLLYSIGISGSTLFAYYDESVSRTSYTRVWITNGIKNGDTVNLPVTNADLYGIKSIDDDGFTINDIDRSTYLIASYCAVG